MKKNAVITVNVIIVLALLLAMLRYTGVEQRYTVGERTDGFLNLTVAMEHVTANYLEGEQALCRSWAGYINSAGMTMEEAGAFLRGAQDNPEVSAHLISRESLTGISTAESVLRPGDNRVSYEKIELFGTREMIGEDDGKSVHITRAYTNPMTGVQSIAFCMPVELRGDGPALLLRVVPVRLFERDWTFPSEDYQSAEISLIDANGDYIIRGASFKNNNFFEFYKSYNQTDYALQAQLEEQMRSETNTFTMLDSHGEKLLIAHTPVDAAGGWTIVASVQMAELEDVETDWTMAAVIAAGLIVLFLFDLAAMQRYNRTLAATAEEAARANRAKTDFLSTMSHDIRTPMNAIIGMTEIASKNPADTETVKNALHRIQLASSHLLTLINDILDISKVESGKLTLNPAVFSLSDLTENLVSISQPAARDKNIDFEFRTHDITRDRLIADQLRVNQVYVNILSNAIKYTESGGRVTADLTETASDREGCVRLIYRVEDNGIGMTKEFMEKMYDAFSRQTDSRVNSIQGTGLGLAITRRMVDLMGGTIECDSEPGRGTTFTVTLDMPAAEDEPEKPRTAEENDADLGGMRILVAEDNDVNWEIISMLLSMQGIACDRAENGQIAAEMLASADEGAWDLVFMDVQMPVMNGLDATRRIRASGGPNASVPIIAMTADAFSENVAECLDAGMNGHIAKPIDMQIVLREIRRIKEGRP